MLSRWMTAVSAVLEFCLPHSKGSVNIKWMSESLKDLEFKCFPLFLFYAGRCFVYVYICVCSAQGDQKGMTDPQGLLQIAVGCPVDAGNGTEALWKNSGFYPLYICNPHPMFDQPLPPPQGSSLCCSLTLLPLSEAQKPPSLPLAEFEIFSLETQTGSCENELGF